MIVDGNGSLQDIGSIRGLERVLPVLVADHAMHDLRSLALLEFTLYSHPRAEIDRISGILLNPNVT